MSTQRRLSVITRNESFGRQRQAILTFIPPPPARPRPPPRLPSYHLAETILPMPVAYALYQNHETTVV